MGGALSTSDAKKLDVSTLALDEEMASQYCVAVSNLFAALGSLPDDVEDSWSAIRTTILQAAQDSVPVIPNVKRPWLSPDSIAVLDKKRDARLRGSTDEWRKYKGIFKARAKADLEEYYNGLADQAEEGIKHHNLRSAFRTIRTLTSSPAHCHSGHNSTIPVTRSDGRPCQTVEETMECWRSHYENALNHPPANLCPELDSAANNAVPDSDIPIDAPTPCEVRRAIRKLRNGRATGPDGIQPELLKYAEEPVPLLSGVEDRQGSSRMA